MNPLVAFTGLEELREQLVGRPLDAVINLALRLTRVLGGLAAGLVAGLVPGGPYAVYPIIESVREGGAGAPAVLTMLTGYSLISVGRIPYGLVFFSPAIVGTRLLVAGTATVLVGVCCFVVGATRRDS